MSSRLAVVLLPALFVMTAPTYAEEPAAVARRVELPIKQVTLATGLRRYAVEIMLGGTRIEAGLDTGSNGLRVLPGTLAPGDAARTQEPDTTRYGSGVKLDGVVATAPLDIGGLKGDVRFEMVAGIGCTPRQPNCAASRVSLADYGVMGAGLPGAGFKAILGVGARAVRVDNPFRRVGATRFVVALPRAEAETGGLILNPSPADLVGFVQVPAYRRSPRQIRLPETAISGCLVARGDARKICGAVVLDTGAPGINVVSPDPLGETWPAGTKAALVLDDGAGHPLATHDLTIGSRADGAHLIFRRMPNLPKTIIRAGIAPYLAYDVLYDLDRAGLAVRPRAPRQN